MSKFNIETVDSAFTKFIEMANKSMTHNLDWQRFYEFTRLCHINELGTTSDQIKDLLIADGFSNGVASIYKETYEHLRDFQRVCDL